LHTHKWSLMNASGLLCRRGWLSLNKPSSLNTTEKEVVVFQILNNKKKKRNEKTKSEIGKKEREKGNEREKGHDGLSMAEAQIGAFGIIVDRGGDDLLDGVYKALHEGTCDGVVDVVAIAFLPIGLEIGIVVHHLYRFFVTREESTKMLIVVQHGELECACRPHRFDLGGETA